MPKGNIYILINPAFPGLVKIGKTQRSSEERATELSSTGLPQPFIVAYDHSVSDCDRVERIIHTALDDCRPNKEREFFQLTVKDAIQKVSRICNLYPSDSESTTDLGLVTAAVHNGDHDDDDDDDDDGVELSEESVRRLREKAFGRQEPKEVTINATLRSPNQPVMSPLTDFAFSFLQAHGNDVVTQQPVPPHRSRTRTKGTEYVRVRCMGCSTEYSVTLYRRERGTTCPVCRCHQSVQVDW